jgi:hypothetical protein
MLMENQPFNNLLEDEKEFSVILNDGRNLNITSDKKFNQLFLENNILPWIHLVIHFAEKKYEHDRHVYGFKGESDEIFFYSYDVFEGTIKFISYGKSVKYKEISRETFLKGVRNGQKIINIIMNYEKDHAANRLKLITGEESEIKKA